MLDLPTVQRLVTALLNFAAAVLAGASVSRLWLGSPSSAWADARRRPVQRAAIAAALFALAADGMLLWLESATMAEVPLSEAAPAVRTMLGSTHLGLAWAIGMAGLAFAAASAWVGKQGRSLQAALPLMGLAVFWYTRSMVSHAAARGDFSLPLLADWLHLGLTSLWVGEVVLAGGLTLRAPATMDAAGRRARARYVASLSGSATLALGGIVVTGLYASWRNLGTLDKLLGNPYGNALAAKLLLVGAAALLGGFNRFFVMPPWLAHEAAGQAAPDALPARFRRVLWVEALCMLGVLAAAAWLASTSPPGEF